ncbi:unnamed protein product [Candidula unifasciata]|uniref:Uncharacterized protein n=1 Tax=Candidula unifasciata TaxID=100452 RepID=A0A8S3YEC8_9EUPU|nr:unnamed protein product [Candidula unifasciata]
MSMLIRTGTIIRKPTRKSSVRRTRSAGSAIPGSHHRGLEKSDQRITTYSVPTSPVAKIQKQLCTEQSLNNSPAKASVTTTTSTIVSYDDSRFTYKTCIDRTLSCETGTGNQDTVAQIQEASSDAENICDFLCTTSEIVCSSGKYCHFFVVINQNVCSCVCVCVRERERERVRERGRQSKRECVCV